MSNSIDQFHSHLPFQKNSLEYLGRVDHLFGHRDNTGQVIRWSDEFGYGQKRPEKTQTVHEGLKKAKDLFEELTDKYRIATAGFYPVVGHFRERNVGSIIVSKWAEGEGPIIEEDGRSRIERATEEQKPAARLLFNKLTGYLTYKVQKGEPFLSDIGLLSQYRYNPNKDDFVLIDVDPYFDTGPESALLMIKQMKAWAPSVLDQNELTNWSRGMNELVGTEEVAA